MVSRFQNQEVGLGLGVILTPDMYKIMNSKRKDTEYKSVTYANKINNTATKSHTDDPCLRYFRAGVSHQGYWKFSHAQPSDHTFTLHSSINTHPAFV